MTAYVISPLLYHAFTSNIASLIIAYQFQMRRRERPKIRFDGIQGVSYSRLSLLF